MKMDTAYIQVSEDEVLRGHHDWILNTKADMEEARMRGMPYRSIYAYSSPRNHDKDAPFMYGDLWIVTTDLKNRFDALEKMRRIVEWLLAMHSSIDPRMFRYYLDSHGSVYLRIPAELFGGQCGAPLVPVYHRKMVEKLIGYRNEPKAMMATCTRLRKREPPEWPYVDVNEDVYDLHQPFMFLEPGFKHGDFFTVEIDYKSFMDMYPADLWSRVEQGKQFCVEPATPELSSLCLVYESSRLARCGVMNPNKSKDSLFQCQFFKSCMEHPENLDEKKKELVLRMLAPLGNAGLKMALERRERLLGCTEPDMRLAFFEALNQCELVTCAEVAHERFCDGDCGVHSPYDLDQKEQAAAALMDRFQEREDGLYYSKIGFDAEDHDEIKVCSPIFSIARVRNADGTGWAREVKVKDPDGQYHQVIIPGRVCMSPNGDKLLQLLCENGLELEPYRNAPTLLKQYFRVVNPARTKVSIASLGWVGDSYVLPDIVIGHYDKKPEYLGEIGAFQVSGTIEDWISRIGCNCAGNSLPELVVQFSLTAILLGRCGQEGGGLHLYGPSSSGKTTLALIACSVWGGGPGQGYLKQWNFTINAIESTAARHNDGLLVLDEIGEATSETVAQASYMLINGQGKSRLRPDATAKEPFRWRVNFLSSGEVATREKIEASGRHKSMAGQEVRIINLPVLGADGGNVFSDLHGFATPADLSDYLKRASKEVYGTLLRAFLGTLCGANPEELHANVETISQDARSFVDRVCPKEGVGQIRRVAIKFGFMAAVGAFAARHGLLPWSSREAEKVAEEWFQIWLDNRGGTGNLEVEKAIKAIQDEWALHRESTYLNLDNYGDGSGFSRDLHGYYRTLNGELEVYIKAEIFTRLVGSVNRKELFDTMMERGMLVLTQKSTRKETQSIGSQNVRIVGIRPEAWLGKVEPTEVDQYALGKPTAILYGRSENEMF